MRVRKRNQTPTLTRVYTWQSVVVEQQQRPRRTSRNRLRRRACRNQSKRHANKKARCNACWPTSEQVSPVMTKALFYLVTKPHTKKQNSCTQSVSVVENGKELKQTPPSASLSTAESNRWRSMTTDTRFVSASFKSPIPLQKSPLKKSPLVAVPRQISLDTRVCCFCKARTNKLKCACSSKKKNCSWNKKRSI